MSGIPSPEVLLLCATRAEAETLIRGVTGKIETIHLGKCRIEGRLQGRMGALILGGIGAVNTAQALTHALDEARPQVVIQFGVGGAYVPSGLSIGGLACATEEIYGDVGVLTPAGWRSAEEIGIPLVPGDPPRFNHFPLDPGIATRIADRIDAQAGRFVSLSQCTGVRERGDQIYERFGAICENMEGAAAAHVCALYDVPFVELRGISNLVEDRDRSRWRIPEAAAAAQEAVRTVVAELDYVMSGS